MIQRRQTLFLLELVFLGIALLFIPIGTIAEPPQNVYLVPFSVAGYVSSPVHFIAIAINILAFTISLITIFLYRRRSLQVTLSYCVLLLWLMLGILLAWGPFVKID